MTETLCVHCGIMRDEKFCNADPLINAEPRTYCSLAPTTPTYGNTYKANQISAPTAETLAAIAKTADAMDIAVIVTKTGLVFRRYKGTRSIVGSLSWFQLQNANDPHGMCKVSMEHMVIAMEEHGK